MKRFILTTVSLGAAAFCASQASGQTYTAVTVDPTTLTQDNMNVYDISGNPGIGSQSEGAYQSSSSWPLADLTSSFSGSTITLEPGQINNTSSYWYTPAGEPGATGNKIMDASLYSETSDVYVNTMLTFSGDVLANSLINNVHGSQVNVNQLGEGWDAYSFIADYSPDNTLVGFSGGLLLTGVFHDSLLTSANPGDHIEYGFEIVGPDVWSTDVGLYGDVVIAPIGVPEPTTWAWASSGSILLLSLFRLRNK